MNDFPSFLLMVLAGALLAAVYLVGLWLTVRSLHQQRHPVILLVMSIVLRMGLVILVFYFILGDQRWQLLLAALVGFVTLRTLVIRRVRHRLPDAFKGKEKTA